MSENNFHGRKHLTPSKAARRAGFADARRTAKVEAAEERQETRRARGVEGQLRELDARLGAGQGAVRERKRLAELLARSQHPSQTVENSTPQESQKSLPKKLSKKIKKNEKHKD